MSDDLLEGDSGCLPQKLQHKRCLHQNQQQQQHRNQQQRKPQQLQQQIFIDSTCIRWKCDIEIKIWSPSKNPLVFHNMWLQVNSHCHWKHDWDLRSPFQMHSRHIDTCEQPWSDMWCPNQDTCVKGFISACIPSKSSPLADTENTRASLSCNVSSDRVMFPKSMKYEPSAKPVQSAEVSFSSEWIEWMGWIKWIKWITWIKSIKWIQWVLMKYIKWI